MEIEKIEKMSSMQIKFCIDILKSRKKLIKAQKRKKKIITCETDSISQIKGKIKNLEKKIESKNKRRRKNGKKKSR